jgi:hypothetical protein
MMSAWRAVWGLPAQAHTTDHIFAPVNCNGRPDHTELWMTMPVQRSHCTQIQTIDHAGRRHRRLAGTNRLLLALGTLVRGVTYRLVFGVPIRSILLVFPHRFSNSGRRTNALVRLYSHAQSHRSTILPAPTKSKLPEQLLHATMCNI